MQIFEVLEVGDYRFYSGFSGGFEQHAGYLVMRL
jgi:hypothetical protein